eukprot:TRINITY_DN237_c0_g1_i1.p1 TRINITY_DN237_c0_g1~~TRINITY_DN237_c0_g1_i1.p1  ORF type:complete len:399 (+),score=86.17 TRINITY_DN237_c0_g1_i1:101-1297(+)
MNTTCNMMTQTNNAAFGQQGIYFDDFYLRECSLDNISMFPPTSASMGSFDSYHVIKGTEAVESKPQEIDFQDPVLDFDFSDQFHILAPKIEEDWCSPAIHLKSTPEPVYDSRPVVKTEESYLPSTKRRKVEYDDNVYSIPVSPSLSTSEDSSNEEETRNRTPAMGFQNVSEHRPMPAFSLVIGKQPADGVVYKRILKPSPAVMLLEENTFMKTNRLFIDVVLIREDNGKEVDILEGNHPLPVCNGMYTIFKKLKIKETSRVHKTKFRLKFRLVQCNNQNYTPIPNVFVLSTPISVYSHSSYITKKKKSDAVKPPSVMEVMPPVCPSSGGSRCVIIGSNFVNTPKLKVKIGNTTVTPTFHESGTLVITTPYFATAGPRRITVSNDSQNFTHSDTWLIVE